MKREAPTEKRSRKFPDALVFTSSWMVRVGSWRGTASSKQGRPEALDASLLNTLLGE